MCFEHEDKIMGEGLREGISSNCECAACGASIRVAFHLGRGDMVYCEECQEPYIIENRYPVILQVLAERQLGTPWLDGSFFI